MGAKTGHGRRKQRKAGNIREPGLVASTEEGVGGGRGRVQRSERTQQLSLRGDRCFLMRVFEVLTHPGDLLALRHF